MSSLGRLLVVLAAVCASVIGRRHLTPAEKAWMQKHNPMELKSIDEQFEINTKRMTEFRANLEGVVFSGVFTDNSVLQRQPFYASLYGAADTPNTAITLTMTDDNTQKTTKYNTKSMDNGDWKVTLSETFQNGGDYTFMVECDGCKVQSSDRITNVTFGDVIFCAGQVSNSFICSLQCAISIYDIFRATCNWNYTTHFPKTTLMRTLHKWASIPIFASLLLLMAIK